ncbi:hypothetical protein PoB_006589300 [Plakobranchus ocellatus]|uniref:Uncharacterized protein n=1 Tax=Plakobranchus ocellatus TaxID=259542 RepID=A0AAV4D5C5_9GAST|nr:hypothetical protein PoB_006589300 [Plakobranchus ocellatus]
MGSDNASVKFGKHNEVVAKLRSQQPNVIALGFPCHLTNLVAQKTALSLPVSVYSLLVDLFYYMEGSVNKKLRLKVIQEFLSRASTPPGLPHQPLIPAESHQSLPQPGLTNLLQQTDLTSLCPQPGLTNLLQQTVSPVSAPSLVSLDSATSLFSPSSSLSLVSPA